MSQPRPPHLVGDQPMPPAADDQRQPAAPGSAGPGHLHVVAGPSPQPAATTPEVSVGGPAPTQATTTQAVLAALPSPDDEGIEVGRVAEAVLATMELHAPQPHPFLQGQNICAHEGCGWPCPTVLVIAQALSSPPPRTGPQHAPASGAQAR